MKKILSLLVVLMLAAMSGCAPTPQKSTGASGEGTTKKITIAGNGGKIEKIIREEIAPKFKEETGIEINYIAGLSGEILSKVELQKKAPQIDIAFFVPLDVARANEKGLVEVIDKTKVPNLKNVDSRFIAIDNVAAPAFGLVNAPAYNTESFKKNKIKPIESWNDLASPAYKGKTAFADISNDWGFNTLYSFALANGGSIDNLEPGLKKAKELAGYSSTFYKNSTQMMPAIQQGAADVTVMGSYVIADLAVNSGLPLKMVVPKEGVYMHAFSATLVKNSPNQQEAIDFINYLISEESQKTSAEAGFYPVLKGMKLPEKYESVIGLKESDKTYKPDVKKLAEIRSEWTDRWSKEVTPELGKLLK
ncbi:polyamine ABC transporter substrate-binding protein [Peribacillus butanolivorans]|uniref:ABC transporter substrate-binding protein n=1 Tax=Peribacillus butanolivorans TaxID=421767 RepID=A0AAX0S732_9BACI|nr:ABC transporter substrate-binding protein [Peribacillus butanolivorans]PEJ37759.1 ABC transporter substrate-binding protein [Peribacillus butanolivorans]